MEIVEVKKALEIPITFYRVLFALLMLLSLDNLFDAERAISKHVFPGIPDPLFVTYNIPVLWIFGLLIAVILQVNERRGLVSRQVSGLLLMLLGFAVSSGYHMLGKFADGL